VVTHGTLQFAGGFNNIGVVQGLLSYGPSGVKVTANAAGQTTFFGGTGNNLIKVSAAPAYVDGGAGFDTLEIAGDMTLAAGSIVNVEAITVDNGVSADLSNLAGPYPITQASVAGGGSTVTGTHGADTIAGGTGDDVIAGGLSGDTLTGGSGGDRFVYNAIANSTPGTSNFDRITDFTAGSGTGADKIDLSHITGVTTIQGMITPASPSEMPPATGLHANSIAWYQVGTETVVIANATSTANHVDMEIVLNGVTASTLSTVAGVNFIPDPPAGGPGPGMALMTQFIAASFAQDAALGDGKASPTPDATHHQSFLAPPTHG
jgi:hypothetical protein